MARIINALEQVLDNNGNPLIGGQLFFYESGGSTTLKTTYSDSAETTANANPVVLDASGRCPAVFGSGTYRVIIKDRNDVQIDDPIDPVGGNVSTANDDYSALTIYSKGDVIRFGLIYYKSKTNSNQGNSPLTSATNWVATPSTIVTMITASDAAWTPNELTTSIQFTAIGGGGGGGGADGISSQAAAASGGAGGGSVILDQIGIDTTYAITIGAAGAAGAGTGGGNGGAGGNTTIASVGVTITAGGGGAGIGMVASVSFLNNSQGATGGTASGGDVNMNGGGTPTAMTLASDTAQTSFGGASMFGLSTAGTSQAQAGASATYYGGGGSGSTTLNETTDRDGGVGFQGVVRIVERL